MKHRESKSNRATFVEVFGSIKFDPKKPSYPAGRWPQPGFAVNGTVHQGVEASDDQKQLVRSSN